jgi:hypothetical protein
MEQGTEEYYPDGSIFAGFAASSTIPWSVGTGFAGRFIVRLRARPSKPDVTIGECWIDTCTARLNSSVLSGGSATIKLEYSLIPQQSSHQSQLNPDGSFIISGLTPGAIQQIVFKSVGSSPGRSDIDSVLTEPVKLQTLRLPPTPLKFIVCKKGKIIKKIVSKNPICPYGFKRQ